MKAGSENIRERILDTAVRLLKECGLKKLAQPQVAKEAKVRQSHLTYYFPKRSDLILAVMEKTLSSIGDLANKHLPKGLSSATEEKVLAMVTDLLRDRERTRAIVGLMVESDEHPELREKMRELADQQSRLIAAVNHLPADDPKVAVAHAAIWGLGLQELLFHGSHKRRPALDEQVRVLQDWLKKGAKK